MLYAWRLVVLEEERFMEEGPCNQGNGGLSPVLMPAIVATLFGKANKKSRNPTEIEPPRVVNASKRVTIHR
jgi:hypothetical protein